MSSASPENDRIGAFVPPPDPDAVSEAIGCQVAKIKWQAQHTFVVFLIRIFLLFLP